MKKRFILLILVCAAVAFIFAYPRATLPAEKIELDLPVAKEELDNGLTVLVRPVPYHPIVAVFACVRTGLSNEGEYAGTGISHFVEHMVFKGTETRVPGAIEKEVKSFGGYINASTGLDSTCYYIIVPKEYYKNALELIADMTMSPKFDAAEFEKEKEVILNEIRMRNDDPSSQVMKLLWENSYMYHPYKYPVIGYEGLFKKLTRDDLARYHDSRYAPNNMVLGIAGDVDAGEALAAAKDIFARFERRKTAAVVSPAEQEQISRREADFRMDTNLAYLAMGYHTTGVLDSDLFASDVLSIILGEGEGSRLYKTLVKDKKLLYSLSTANYTPKYPGLFLVQGIGAPENIEEAKKTVLAEIESLRNGAISEEELERAKKIVLSGYLRGLETAEGQARAVTQGELLTGDPYFAKRYVDGVSRVTAVEVTAAAKKYLAESNLTVAAVLPALAKKEEAPKKTVSVARMPEMASLDSGIRIILKEDKRVPLVSITCAYKGGLMAETGEENGISNFTAAMLLKGTRSRKEDQIVPAMESMGGTLDPFSGYNSFGLTISFMKENTDEALDILGDVIKNPAFPDDQIDREKEQVLAAIKAQDDDIFSRGFLAFRKELFGDYPYGRRIIGEAATVEALTKEQISEFYSKWRDPQNLVISAVGDFEKNDLLSRLSRIFKDVKPVREPPAYAAAAEPAIGEKREKRFSMHREQALVILGFRGTRVTDKDKYALAELTSVLSGQDGRMHQNIREALGAAYTLGVYSVPAVEPGYIFFYAACGEQDVDAVINKMLDEIAKVKKEPVGEDELKSAKRRLVAEHRMSLQSAADLATQMAADELYGLGYADYLEYEDAVSAVTREDVRKAAQKYLDTDRYALVVVTPHKDAAQR